MPFRSRSVHEGMLKLVTAYWQSQLIFVAARLGIADVLSAGPLSVEAIAKRVGADPPNLQRVLRALASVGVFASDARGRFRLTPLAQTLRSDHPQSLRSFALMIVDDYNWQAWASLGHAVTTGDSAFEHAHGLPAFPYMQRHPQKEQAFSESMASISTFQNAAVARAYAFGRVRRIVDVGGAHGHLLATILRRHRTVRGVLFDQPQVIAAAAAAGYVTATDIRDRCEMTGGDFFEAVPVGADAYLLKYILHDWDDDRCVRVLENCRRAMDAGGRVLIIDHIVSAGNRYDFSKLLDINMMVVPGGRERTRDEFREVLTRAGLRLRRVIATASRLSILEAVDH